MRGWGWLLSLLLCCPAAVLSASDWPMWRYDAARSGAAAEELPEQLQWQWTLPLPDLVPAWPQEPRLGFDNSYEPVVAGRRMIVGHPGDGSITAHDLATGEVCWRFFTDGPVRFAPALSRQCVYAGSDDGFLYCLSLEDGAVLWKVRGAPPERPDRRHLGNNRLISFWPVRGGPLLADGCVYFAAGIWPTMGVFVVAVDAQTGSVLWRNGELSTIDQVRLDHNELGTSGLSPQGYLVLHGDTLLVPNGRSMPAGLDRHSGQLRYYVQGYRHGDCRVIAGEQVALVGQSGVVDLETGREVGSRWASAGSDAPQAFDAARFHLFEGPIHPYKLFPGCSWRSVLCDGLAYGLEGGAFYAYDLRRTDVSEYDVQSGQRVLKPWRWDAARVWQYGQPQPGRPAAPLVKAGRRLYGYHGKSLVGLELADSGESPRLVWKTPCDAEPTSLLAAGGRLLVVTKSDIRCYGAEPGGPAAPLESPAVEPPPGGKAAELVSEILKATGVDQGYCVLAGLGDGGVLRELIRGSNLKLIGVDADRRAIDALRGQFAAQGLYATRVELAVGNPAEFSLPPYLASLLVAQDPAAIGFPDGSAAGLFEILRPYGGTACVLLPPEQQADFEQWVDTAGLASARVRRAGEFALLERVGPLPGSAVWTHECSDASRSYFSQDRRVRTPLGILWYGDGPDYGFWKHKDYGTGVKPQVVGGRLIAFQIHTQNLIAYDVYTGRQLWKQSADPFTRYACLEDGIYVAGGGRLRVLEPETGAERTGWALEIEAGQTPFVSDIRVAGDVVVVALAPHKVRVIEQGLWDSTTLVALDRHSGEILWKRAAQQRFNNHAWAMGDGLVFAVDSLSPIEVDRAQRHGQSEIAAVQPSTLLALDARTGQVRWTSVVEHPYRTYGPGGWTAMRANDDWLGYAQTCGLLLVGKSQRTTAYQGLTGEVVWQKQTAAGQPWILRGETAVAQSGAVYDLGSGQPQGPAYDLKRGGCNYAVAAQEVILLRDRSACLVDADSQRKQSVYAARSGCSNSLVAADGVLSVPNFAVGCICNYPIQASFAMFHLPEVGEWP